MRKTGQELYNTKWRLMATAIYTPPTDCKVFGALDIDVTDAEKFIREQREKGKKLTITHLVTAALARTMAFDTPEINCFVRRGRIVPREYIDIMVAVNINKGEEMSAIRIKDAHKKTVFEIAQEVSEKADDTRTGKENKAMRNKYLLSKIPWPFRRWLFIIIRGLINGLGIELKSMGLSERTFGSLILSNVGVFDLNMGMPALFPAARIPAVIVMGKIEEKPVVRDGKIVVRSMLPCSGTFDHRIVDGNQVGRFAKGIIKRLSNPEELGKPETLS